MAAADTLPRQPDTASIDRRVVKALSHPTRVRILGLLRDREMVSPVQIAGELGLALGTVGYHVRRLESLGFIELARRTQRRGAVEHHYRACTMLQPQPQVVGADMASGNAAIRGVEALATAREAEEAVARGGFDAVTARSDVRLLRLDAQGRAQLPALLAKLAATVERVERASAKRLKAAGDSAAPRECTAVMMLFDCEVDAD